MTSIADAFQREQSTLNGQKNCAQKNSSANAQSLQRRLQACGPKRNNKMPTFTFTIEPCKRSFEGWTPCDEDEAECFRVSREYPGTSEPTEVKGYLPTRQDAWDFIARKMGRFPL